jgi:phage host-nuclease inhibitor protein Gam
MVEPLDFVPSHEPDYEFESGETAMDIETLHEELNALTSEERSLLLSDMDNLTSNQKTKYTLLVQRLKNTLTSPCCQIIPLT